ncbi:MULTISPECIES: multicopper oxidase family protein [unclassified Crossiella]|uniref:multicopper oxidase family protein n=1 Tax=unclassified Crossiella TaxID=2620835 RepID=UPI001FFE5395|nr:MULTISPECIES: multicopper oxidase family protein [unclassified Crossiella]MCK2244553.1 multicopper oxidase family protein [Crossiella sp. S99.2]MCK2258184.1 multicopper oxidase family protein [Crossiella sp. S99.1]
MSGRLPRRTFLGLAGGAGALLTAGLIGPRLLRADAPGTGEVLHSRIPLPEPFQVPLPIPRVLSPQRTAEADHHTITQRAATAEILPGVRTPIWGYDGTFPGPTIESRRNRTTIVHHRNELPVPTVVHLHGGHTPADFDGYPTDLVLPVTGWSGGHGHHMVDARARVTHGSRDYVFPLRQRAATLWYHDHRMDFTGPAVYRGLAGFHLVRDEEEDALGLPAGERELPLLIADRAFDEHGAFAYPSLDPSLRSVPGVEPEYVEGVFGDVILVNGAPWPVHEVTATRHRLRLLNGSNARRYDLALDPPPPGGAGFVQIGSDQGLLDAPRAHDHLPIAPAERYDVIVDFGRYPVGAQVTLVNRLGAGSTALIMRFVVTRTAPEDSRIPPRLSEIAPLHRSQAVAIRDFSFTAGQIHGRTGWVIGGEPFAPDRMSARPRLGDVEIWRFVADVHHPVHLHLVGFQILSRGSGPPGPFDGGLKDTVDLSPGQAVEVITRFEGYRGRYVFHCHNAEHEDMAMMANFEVL